MYLEEDDGDVEEMNRNVSFDLFFPSNEREHRMKNNPHPFAHLCIAIFA